MTRRHSNEKFDYSKIEPYSCIQFYGMHIRDGHLKVDTQRLSNFISREDFPEIFDQPRNTHYFTPKKVKINDYYINRILAVLNKKLNDWYEVYRPFFDNFTFEKFKDIFVSDNLSSVISADDYEQVQEDSIIPSAIQSAKFELLREDFSWMYLESIQNDFFNILNYIAVETGYDKEDFSFSKFLIHFDGLINGKNYKDPNSKKQHIKNLEHFKYFDFYQRLINFYKHKTYKSYVSLCFKERYDDRCYYKKEFQKYVYPKKIYVNGDNINDYLRLPRDLGYQMLLNLSKFAIEFCKIVFDEDVKEASWNSEEFIENKIKDLVGYNDY